MLGVYDSAMTNTPKGQEQKKVYRQYITTFLLSVLLLLVGVGVKKIDEMATVQDNAYELLWIEYKSTDYALRNKLGDEYSDIKKEKKDELKEDYKFKHLKGGD